MTSFGFTSTASEVLAGVDLTGQRALITGANSGIGVETARTLAAAGADVVLAVRNVVAGKEIVATINNAQVADPRPSNRLGLCRPEHEEAGVLGYRRWCQPE